jgi:TolB-like protein/tetratricopeptide (TPR) repeat protein
MPDVFLSYSREDQPTARKVAEGLERAGLSVWWDQSLRSGEAFDRVTEKALDDARAVVVLWSKHSVESRWVRAEASQADRASKLLPVTIEPCKLPIMFELTQSPDLSGWQGDEADRRWQMFVDDVRALLGGQPASATHSHPQHRPAPAQRQPWRTVAIALIAFAVLGAGLWFWQRTHDGSHTLPQAATTAAATTASATSAVPQASVAVLPFKDMSPNKDQEYFADGIAEEILNSLAAVKDLQVSGRTSSFSFKGKDEDMKVIGEKLGVAHILEGSVRKDGDQLRIVAQLVKASDGFHLWSKTYERPKGDVFAIQEDIARSVAEALQISLGVGALGRVPGMTRDPDAYDALLEAISRTTPSTRAGFEKRIDRLEHAVDRDPSFAFAWLVMADMYVGLMQEAPGDPEEVAEWLRRSEAAEANAKRLLPDSALVRALPAFRAFSRGRWVEFGRVAPELQAARNELGLSGALGPPQFMERFHVFTDHGSKAVDGLRRLRTRDPLDATISIYLAEAYANSGNLQAATAEQDRGLKIASVATQNLVAANALMTAKATGDAALIEDRWKQLLAVSADQLGLYPLRNRPADARARIRRLVVEQPGLLSSSRIALWSAYFGDPEFALQALRGEKLEERTVITAAAIWRPVMKDVRKLPGFKDLARDLGFVDYWREFGWGDHCKPVGETDFECQ